MENMQVLFWLQYVMINCHWKSETNFYYDWQLLQTQDFVYYILLTNRVRGPYRKLRTKIFPPRFMAQARSARAINRRGKNEDP